MCARAKAEERRDGPAKRPDGSRSARGSNALHASDVRRTSFRITRLGRTPVDRIVENARTKRNSNAAVNIVRFYRYYTIVYASRDLTIHAI